jgi:predicted MFS family arabinose efflux permease
MIRSDSGAPLDGDQAAPGADGLPPPTPSPAALPEVLWAALALAWSAAVSLGLARFAYALLLPPMRDDLGWSYTTAGAMNTVNAAGYLVGALAMPALLRRREARTLLLAGGAAAALVLALHGAVRSDAALLALRLASGVASAVSFVAGGLLAARLAQAPAAAGRSGLVLGLYYGGVGLGIVAAALGLPPLLAGPPAAPAAALAGWAWGWVLLGALAAACTAATARGTARAAGLLAAPAAGAGPAAAAALGPLAPALAGYGCFGLGYIGYMTFIVSLLREQGLADGRVTAFFALLGLGVVASSFVWAGLLQRHRGGRPMATLNALLALATLLPVLSTHALAVFASGALFGGVFLSVVASTTALVRHNLPPAAWARGIAAFTIVFAAGQIVGPSLTGAIADATGGAGNRSGLALGLACSAAVLALGALLAAAQRPLASAAQSPRSGA